MSSRRRTYGLAGFGAILLAVLLASVWGCGGGSSDVSATDDGSGEDGGGVVTIDAGLPDLELVAPAESGAGEVPVFEWSPVEGAASYRLVVLDGDGAALWSWTGAEITVRLGGLLEEPAEGTPGPIITAGSSWSVVAFGADGSPLAVSEVRPVSP